MRIKPSIGLAVGIWIAYLIVWIGGLLVLQPDDADFSDSFESVANSRYIALALIGGIVFGVVVTTALGWWREVLHDDRPVTGWLRWMPLIVLGMILLSTDYAAIPDIDADVMKWIILASVFVGITEELTFRGLEVVTLRKTPLPESRVWLISTVLFGLIHVPNALLGAELWISAVNAVLAFCAGTFFYVIRRSTGSIIPAMVAHGLWDFTLFTVDDGILPALRLPMVIIGFIVFWLTRDRAFGEPADTGSAPAAA